MSGCSRRRNSKWDHKDSEALPESFHERSSARKPRELLSPSRASRRHESRGKESMGPLDREGNGARMSPGLDDWSDRHYGRSPKNDWRRSYRSRSRSRSRSLSRSRSRSPSHNSRREPPGNDRSRGRSGVSELTCRDFSAGRCRRGSHCQFLHEEVELYNSGRPLKNSSPDESDIRHQRTRGSRYSPGDVKDYAVRGERSANLCNDFLKGNCRRGSSCRYAHDTAADVIEKGPVDVYRDRDNDHRGRDTYPERNHDREPHKRGETPLCKFFAAGNCRNGKRCRFSHQVQEGISPERQSQCDRRGPDDKFENDPVWDGPPWNDATGMSDIPMLPAWGENKIETTEVANEMTTVRSRDDTSSHDIINSKQTWDPSVGFDESKTRDGQARQWKTENCVPSIENFSGDMEMSPRDVLKLQNFGSPNAQTLPVPDVSFPAVQQNITGETSYEKRCPHVSHDQKVLNDSYSGLNPNFKDGMPSTYLREGRNGIGNDDNNRLTSNPMMNVPPAQNIFQSDPRINLQLISSIDPSAGQSQLPFSSYHSGSDGMQMKTSHNSSSFLDGKVADGPHLAVNASSVASALSTKPNTVSSEQLAQLSHLTASLAQLLESRQLPQSTSGVIPNGISSHSDFQASNPAASGATFLPNQAPDMLKLYDPISDSAEPKLLRDSTPHAFTSLAEQKSSEKEPFHDSGNVGQQEHNREASKYDENDGKATGGRKAPENGPSEDMGVDDGADDGKKLKDVKGIRAFKFALADFVKELLKPTWKDGQVSKEVYKAIVKKVVDKVIETQGQQIPQTKEKIDQYLSYSKPKLDKLVQAYVGKYQKGKV